MVFFEITVLVSLFVNYGSGLECPDLYLAVGTVCGTDGVTYPTLCEMEVARIFDGNLDIAYFGSCSTHCRNKWKPVCGTDLVTYPNFCELQHAARFHYGLEVLHIGICHAADYEEYEYYEKRKRAPHRPTPIDPSHGIFVQKINKMRALRRAIIDT